MASFFPLLVCIIFQGMMASHQEHNAFKMAGFLKAAPAYLQRENSLQDQPVLYMGNLWLGPFPYRMALPIYSPSSAAHWMIHPHHLFHILLLSLTCFSFLITFSLPVLFCWHVPVISLQREYLFFKVLIREMRPEEKTASSPHNDSHLQTIMALILWIYPSTLFIFNSCYLLNILWEAQLELAENW